MNAANTASAPVTTQALLAREKPFFSIVIPTRNRSALARMAAGYALTQDFENFELILLDNSDHPDLSTKEFGDKRCKVVTAPTVLSMRDNWERALDFATGRYVMVLSDKDALVPGALRRLADAIAATNAPMLSFRKAAYGDPDTVKSFIQRCSGQIKEYSGEEVLRAWFERVQHFHEAPMIYNSAVLRDVLLELRAANGHFFVGTSPDIGSGAVLLARLRRYHLVDRPLVVSKYGAWSIGMAAMRGVQGASAACIAEYGRDPMRDAGLVSGIPGSIAETLLECKKQFPKLFIAYRLRWPGYVKSVLWDLFRREQLGIDTSADRDFLRIRATKQYSRVSSAIGHLTFRWERADLRSRLHKRLVKWVRRIPGLRPSPSDGSPSRTAVAMSREAQGDHLTAYFATPLSTGSAFQDVRCAMVPASLTFEDVVGLAGQVNCELDAQVRTHVHPCDKLRRA